MPTIRKGIGELKSGERLDAGHVRRPGGGRHALADTDPTLLKNLERLVSESCRGDPESLNAKTREGSSHPDRDAQFEHINAVAAAAVTAGEPVISVDTTT